MRLFITLLFLTGTFFSHAQNRVTIYGKVTDQNGKPLPGVKVAFAVFKADNTEPVTDASGVFVITNVGSNHSYVLTGSKDQYLTKKERYYHDKERSKDTVFVSFPLRERKAAMVDVSKISAKDIGITVQQAIARFRLDTAEAVCMQEPPGTAQGIMAELGDSTRLYLQIRPVSNYNYDCRRILGEKVIGIELVFTNCKKKAWGTGFLLSGARNPYCKH